MSDTSTTTLLGEGRLNWFRDERISDRYGSFHLADDAERAYQQFPDAPVGVRGTLSAEITETRQSGHIGDVFRGIGPSTPAAGDRIELGTGELFTQRREGVTCIGLIPADGREHDWLDPQALYRCHEQTVRLYFTPEGSELT